MSNVSVSDPRSFHELPTATRTAFVDALVKAGLNAGNAKEFLTMPITTQKGRVHQFTGTSFFPEHQIVRTKQDILYDHRTVSSSLGLKLPSKGSYTCPPRRPAVEQGGRFTFYYGSWTEVQLLVTDWAQYILSGNIPFDDLRTNVSRPAEAGYYVYEVPMKKCGSASQPMRVFDRFFKPIDSTLPLLLTAFLMHFGSTGEDLSNGLKCYSTYVRTYRQRRYRVWVTMSGSHNVLIGDDSLYQ